MKIKVSVSDQKWQAEGGRVSGRISGRLSGWARQCVGVKVGEWAKHWSSTHLVFPKRCKFGGPAAGDLKII